MLLAEEFLWEDEGRGRRQDPLQTVFRKDDHPAACSTVKLFIGKFP